MAVEDDRLVRRYARMLAGLFPGGRVWEAFHSHQGTAARLLRGIASEYARFHTEVERLRREFSPGRADVTLRTWEGLAGLRPDSGTPKEERREEVVAALAARGGRLDRGYYIGIARNVGRSAEIVEYRKSRAGVSAVGDRVSGAEWAFHWVMVLDGDTRSNGLERVVERSKPGGTTVSFHYPAIDGELTT